MSLRTSKLYSIRLNFLHSFSLFSSLLFSLSLSSFTVCEKWSQMLFFLSLKGFVWMHIIIYHHSWLSLSSCMMLYAEFLIVFVLYLGIDTRVVYYYGTTQIWLVWTFFCVCALTLSWCLFIPKKKKIMVFNSCFITCHLLTNYKMAVNVFCSLLFI